MPNEMIALIKDTVNILFFVMMIIIGILSYRQAKRTLFSPIRAEVLKMQITAMQPVIETFQCRDEAKFVERFDFENIVRLNSLRMFCDFVHMIHHDAKLNESAIDHDLKALTHEMIPVEEFGRRFTLVDEGADSSLVHANHDLTWSHYEYRCIGFTDEFLKEHRLIEQMSTSPILPEDLRRRINSFLEAVDHNLALVGKVIDDCAKEMPDRYGASDKIGDFGSTWLWNRFNSERRSLEEASNEILRYVGDYLRISKIME